VDSVLVPPGDTAGLRAALVRLRDDPTSGRDWDEPGAPRPSTAGHGIDRCGSCSNTSTIGDGPLVVGPGGS